MRSSKKGFGLPFMVLWLVPSTRAMRWSGSLDESEYTLLSVLFTIHTLQITTPNNSRISTLATIRFNQLIIRPYTNKVTELFSETHAPMYPNGALFYDTTPAGSPPSPHLSTPRPHYFVATAS